MKTNRPFLLIIAVLAIFSSCDLLEDIDDVDFTANYSLDYAIEVTEENGTVAAMEILDITEDDDVEEYKDKLQDITVDSVKIGFSSYTGGENASFSGTIQYADASGTPLTDFVSVFNLMPKTYADSGEKLKLDLTNAEVQALTNLLVAEESVTIAVAGAVGNGPASFNATVYFYTTITADALK